jgi:hypothetical protein
MPRLRRRRRSAERMQVCISSLRRIFLSLAGASNKRAASAAPARAAFDRQPAIAVDPNMATPSHLCVYRIIVNNI